MSQWRELSSQRLMALCTLGTNANTSLWLNLLHYVLSTPNGPDITTHGGLKHLTFCPVVILPTEEEVEALSSIRICLECHEKPGEKRKEHPMNDGRNKHERRKRRGHPKKNRGAPLSPPRAGWVSAGYHPVRYMEG